MSKLTKTIIILLIICFFVPIVFNTVQIYAGGMGDPGGGSDPAQEAAKQENEQLAHMLNENIDGLAIEMKLVLA